jgi:hypothetical protein
LLSVTATKVARVFSFIPPKEVPQPLDANLDQRLTRVGLLGLMLGCQHTSMWRDMAQHLHLNLRPSMAYDSRLFADAVHKLPLKQLSLEGCLRNDHDVRSVAVLLRDTKNLEVLSLFLPRPEPKKEVLFSISDSESDTEPGDDDEDGVDYTTQVPDSLWEMYIKCLDHKLRRINIVNYKGLQLERILAKFLLYESENLKEFSVTFGRCRHKDEIERKLRSWRSNRHTRVTIN